MGMAAGSWRTKAGLRDLFGPVIINRFGPGIIGRAVAELAPGGSRDAFGRCALVASLSIGKRDDRTSQTLSGCGHL